MTLRAAPPISPLTGRFRWLSLAAAVVAFLMLLLSGVAYNVRPLRLKDRAFLDVIAESFNNPIRLWLGYYALVSPRHVPPLSIVLAWWFFGALLMTYSRSCWISCGVLRASTSRSVAPLAHLPSV